MKMVFIFNPGSKSNKGIKIPATTEYPAKKNEMNTDNYKG
jgi:hypothetical protein